MGHQVQESGFSEYAFPPQSNQPFAGMQQGKVNQPKHHQEEEEPLPF